MTFFAVAANQSGTAKVRSPASAKVRILPEIFRKQEA
jgi:hypothetical protein